MLARGDNASSALSVKEESQVHAMTSIWKSKSKNKSRSNHKRRFSDEQIQLLENMFESDTRPELHMKQQLANRLGLQPRQIAIWFQNKRARSKSKLIEHEYNLLKSSYDNLASKFESLKEDNQCLLIQLQKLRNLMEDPQGRSTHGVEHIEKSIDKEYDNTDTNSGEEVKANILLNRTNNENWVPFSDDSGENADPFAEETELLNFPEVTPQRHLRPSENWGNLESSFESSCALDQPSCSSQWWEL